MSETAAWLGDAPHFMMTGTVKGRVMELQLTDMIAAEVLSFTAKREYRRNADGTLRLADFEVDRTVLVDGVKQRIELEFEHDEFNSLTLPATLTLQNQSCPTGAQAYLEVEPGWQDGETVVFEEVGGWAGHLMLALNSGSADEAGLAGSGMIGGSAKAQLGDDHLMISFTVPATETDIDDTDDEPDADDAKAFVGDLVAS